MHFRHLATARILAGGCALGLGLSGGLGRAQTAVPAPILIRGFAPSRAGAEAALEQKLQGVPDATHAEADLRHLTSEPHVAGTDGSKRVAEWLRDQFRSFGFDADIVTYSAYLPLPREVRVELTAPEKIALAAPERPLDQDRNTGDDHLLPPANDYSASGDVTASVIYVNYGMAQDYRTLDSLGVSVKGKLVLARYGHGYRGVKAKLAEEHGAAGLILYSDPADDGYTSGDVFPDGPWRPLESIQRGSILYTQNYPGDPLTPATAQGAHTPPSEAASLPRIASVPISAKDASAILGHLGRGRRLPSGWQGGLPLSYHVGPGDAKVHLKVEMDYQQRPVYDVVAKLRGASDDEWVVLGNHHDAWVYGAADPGSGTTAMLELARSLGELARSGWKPRRTIVLCEWDAEEPGLIGSTDWVEANRTELQKKAVAYINTDVGVTGPNFSASAVPSLKEFIRDATKQVEDPQTGNNIYSAWRNRVNGSSSDAPTRGPVISSLGAGSDFSSFLDFAGIPSIDLSFTGDYGVYHSLYDDFYWMKHFGDPDFSYHATLARLLGVMALRLSEADVEPFDYSAYASEIADAGDNLSSRAAALPATNALLKRFADASVEFSDAASQAQDALANFSYDAQKESAINRGLASVEQGLLNPQGLSGRPWFKHTVFAPGSQTGYSAEILPGLAEALDRHDLPAAQRESDVLASALHRAAVQLNEVSTLARGGAAQTRLGN